MSGDLREDSDARACDPARRSRREDAVRVAHVAVDAIPAGQLGLCWGLVQLGIVELVESVNGKLQQLLRSGIGCNEILVFSIFGFPLRGGCSNRAVQRIDS